MIHSLEIRGSGLTIKLEKYIALDGLLPPTTRGLKPSLNLPSLKITKAPISMDVQEFTQISLLKAEKRKEDKKRALVSRPKESEEIPKHHSNTFQFLTPHHRAVFVASDRLREADKRQY